MLIFIIASLAVAAGFATLSYLKIPAWKARGYGDRDFKWNLIILASAISSLASAYLAYFLSDGSLYTSLATGVLGYLLVLSSVTDFALMKIPSEPTTLAQWVAVPAIIWLWPSLNYEDKTSLVVWFGIVFVFAVLSYMRRFGWGDVKLMFAFGTLLAWWVGPLNMMIGFLGSSFLALLMIPVLKRMGLTVKKGTSEATVWNPETKQMESTDRESEVTVDTEGSVPPESEGSEDSPAPKKTRKRTFVPFGPALLISFMGIALFASATVAPNHFGWGQEDPMPEGFCFILDEGADPADYEGLTICPE